MESKTSIQINGYTFIIPLISGISEVKNHGLSNKFGFFIYHSGTTTLLEFSNEQEAQKKSNELQNLFSEYWNNKNNKFSSTNKEESFKTNQGNKKKW